MSAIHEVRLGRLGDTVDEVVIVSWLVEVGDVVIAGQPLVRVETDKVEIDVEATAEGRVVEILVAEDEEVATGAVLCTITTA